MDKYLVVLTGAQTDNFSQTEERIAVNRSIGPVHLHLKHYWKRSGVCCSQSILSHDWLVN